MNVLIWVLKPNYVLTYVPHPVSVIRYSAVNMSVIYMFQAFNNIPVAQNIVVT